MKDKEEKNLQFVLRYYRHGKLDTTKALNKITGIRQQNNLHRLWIYSSGIAAAILICIVSYTLLSRSDNNMISVTADAGITRHFLPDSTLVILSKGSTLKYDSDNYGKKSREVNMSGKVFFSVRRNEQSPFMATAMYAQVKVLGTEFEIDERMQDTVTNVYVKSGKVMFKGKNSSKGIIL
ncbi:FecR family protein, partial [uncultured Bacteroides sp.]|uniref:FecR family protein n=1 Tax=uncultured Bacteroides sp. TaxID=162156 RepID=UPI0025927E85